MKKLTDRLIGSMAKQHAQSMQQMQEHRNNRTSHFNPTGAGIGRTGRQVGLSGTAGFNPRGSSIGSGGRVGLNSSSSFR